MLSGHNRMNAGQLAGDVPRSNLPYHDYAVQRRIRVAGLAITAYRGGVDIFRASPGELSESPSLSLATCSRGRGSNP